MTILWYQEPVAVLSTGQRATKSWRSRLPWNCPSSTPTSSSWKRSCRKWTVLWRSTSMTSEWATGPALCPSVHSFGCWGVGGGGVKGVLWRRGDVITSQRPALQTCLSGKTVLSLLSVCLSSSLTLAHILSAVLLVSLCLFLPPLSSPLPPPIPSSHSVYTSSPTPHPLCTLPPYLCVCVMPLPLSLSVSVTLCASPSSLSLPPPPLPLSQDCVPVCLSGLSVYTSFPPVYAYFPYHLSTSICLSVCVYLSALSLLTFPTTCLPLSVCLSVCTSLPSYCLPSLPPVYLYLPVCMCVPLCPLIAYLPYHLSTSICLSVCVCMCIHLCLLSAYLAYHLSTSLYVYTSPPSLCLPSLPPIYLCLSVHLSVRTSPSVLAFLPTSLSVLPLCVYLLSLSLLAFPTTCLLLSVCLSVCVYLSLSAPTSLPPSLLASCLSLCLSVCIPLHPLSLLAFPTTCLLLSVCLSVCVYLSLSAPTSLPPSLLASCLSLCLSVCIPLHPLSLLAFPNTCLLLSVCLSVCLCVCLCIPLPLCFSYKPTSISACLLLICLSACLCVYNSTPSVCLPSLPPASYLCLSTESVLCMV